MAALTTVGLKKSVGMSSEGESKSKNLSGEKVYFTCEEAKEGMVIQGVEGCGVVNVIAAGICRRERERESEVGSKSARSREARDVPSKPNSGCGRVLGAWKKEEEEKARDGHPASVLQPTEAMVLRVNGRRDGQRLDPKRAGSFQSKRKQKRILPE
jgi:hypothetical protein